MRFLVSCSHSSPNWQFHNTPVYVGHHKAHIGDNVYDKYYANHPQLGCGKDAYTPEAAIRQLFQDHACYGITMEKVEE